MLNRILQTLCLCFAAILLTTGVALSSPLPSGLVIADHTLDHNAAPAPETAKSDTQTPPSAQPTPSPQADRDRDRTTKLKAPQPTQANPAVPYDPYDYDAIRKLNREIYGEVKDNQG